MTRPHASLHGSWIVAVLLTILAPAARGAEDGGSSISLLRLVFSGGWAMIPLALCSLAVLMLVVRLFLDLKPDRFVPEAAIPTIRQSMARRDLAGVWRQLQAQPTVLSTVLTAGISKARAEDPREGAARMEASMESALAREEESAATRINYLAVVASIAPMLGLLGTVSGMIKAFQKIGLGGMGKPELLAGNIGEALVTTATGLVIAIPAMFFYFVFRNRLARLISITQSHLEHLLDLFTGDAVPAAAWNGGVSMPAGAPVAGAVPSAIPPGPPGAPATPPVPPAAQGDPNGFIPAAELPSGGEAIS